MKRNLLIISSVFISIWFFATGCKDNEKLFAGGFTEVNGKGLSVFELNRHNGSLNLVSENDAGPGPSYFCFSDRHSIIYVLNEVMQFKGTFGGGLTTLKYDRKSGSFTKLNEMLIPYGGPCFISMSSDSGHLFIANYPNGSVAVIKLDDKGVPSAVTDTILYVKEEPDRSHAHMILQDPAGKRVYVTDLGLDRVLSYNFDITKGKLEPAENGIVTVPSKFGPRHFVFNSEGTKLYVINELGSKMVVFDVDNKGVMNLIQTLPTVRNGFEGNNYCADIHIGKNGKYLYGSNRGENSIVIFKIMENGALTLAGHVSCGGSWPRNFVIDPSGRFLLVGNQKSDSISVFKINRRTGLPEGPLNNYPMKGVACLKFIN